MELLNGSFITIFQGVMLFIIAKIILNMKYAAKDLLYILLIILSGSICYYFFNRFALFIVILAAIFYFYKKVKLYSFLTIIGSILILYLSSMASLLMFLLFDIRSFNIIIVNLVYVLIFASVSIVCSLFLRYLIKILRQSYLSTNKIYITIVALFLFFTFIILFSFMPSSIDKSSTFKLVIVVYVAFILAIVILVIVISISVLREMRYKRQMQEIDHYYKYTLRIEKINNDMRKFRHDYINILLSMSEYIRDDDMPGLKSYFDKNIVPLKDSIQTNSFKINGIERLKIRELKGLLTTKIIQAQENKIRVSVEVPDEINHISINMIDLSRMVGIILDNAIEASLEIEDPLIQIGFMKEENSVVIIIMNKCAKDIPKVHELFQESFSTKGNNRGLGLSTLKEISESKDNVLLDTVIENHYFIQKLEIINTNRKE
ncbi:quorum-sensing sensor histidine kinase AgrC [Staphylococcus carnosus]|uniref:Histidine kinase n=3 Tax=Staphylococcus carnosus TaxID=1281 RepID=A0AAJ0JN58_STACA|nr:GHKL domain-containing protein [Staphylococcus carnosus]KKB24655.1 histidine kinase [Staphylococcus carnosus]QQS84820.1 GHKL domain-containing protein [Staphylococcus carnosus]QRQ04758.1 GHKL domain-containing protein [Staphylococcus carnosus]UTB83244.1 histidine kinase [Staphylococcus carnosus]UTC00105.1 histidine kinase [Staphylococcus carnosus]